ncbi:hypothetical protein DIJ69_22995 [Streptomyces globisporus]|nr:hypothetical protein DIJ69_22995 [Streptomyces globisporus]
MRLPRFLWPPADHPRSPLARAAPRPVAAGQGYGVVRERRAEARRQRARRRALWLAVHGVNVGPRFIRGGGCVTGHARQTAGQIPTHAARSAADAERLLPWTTPEGKPC